MKRIVITIIVILLIEIGAGLIYMFTGSYNVAATHQDSGLIKWVLKTTREESIDRRGEDVIPPEQSKLNNPQVLRTGFEHYNEMCVVCHGAPGVKPGEAREGLNPKPPLLAKAAKHIPTGEMFWVVKHGIKMTGMPAWGPTHSDDKIWAIVAFVKSMPDMSPAQYKAMQQQTAGENPDHDAGDAHSH